MTGQVISDPLHLAQLDRFVIQHESVKASLIIGRFEAVGIAETELDLDDSGADKDGGLFRENLPRQRSSEGRQLQSRDF
jgi:hypothetical protein